MKSKCNRISKMIPSILTSKMKECQRFSNRRWKLRRCTTTYLQLRKWQLKIWWSRIVDSPSQRFLKWLTSSLRPNRQRMIFSKISQHLSLRLRSSLREIKRKSLMTTKWYSKQTVISTFKQHLKSNTLKMKLTCKRQVSFLLISRLFVKTINLVMISQRLLKLKKNWLLKRTIWRQNQKRKTNISWHPAPRRRTHWLKG